MELNFNYHTEADTQHKSFTQDFLCGQYDQFVETTNDDCYGFFKISELSQVLLQAKVVHGNFSHKKTFVQVGIGGSALGPQMLIDALDSSDTQFFFLDNVDSDYLQGQLAKIKAQEALFYVVSKSGGTAETIANFCIIANWLKASGVSEEQFQDYFVFCTDPQNGDLRAFVNEHGYQSLVVPSNIGGRYSVLTHVGILPALFANINVDALFSGAEKIKERILDKNLDTNPLFQTAAHIAYLWAKKNISQTVLMPYSSKLKSFSHWFVQLWAESLGKIRPDNSGHGVGLTPIPSYGATDQHSQMQLFMEGPNDKCLFLLNVKKRANDFSLNNNFTLPAAQKLSAFSLNQLMEAEFQGTLKALADRKRNYIHICLDQLNEEHLGALIMYFESLTVVMSQYLLIDPFDQPGVELGKKYAYEWLNSLS